MTGYFIFFEFINLFGYVYHDPNGNKKQDHHHKSGEVFFDNIPVDNFHPTIDCPFDDTFDFSND